MNGAEVLKPVFEFLDGLIRDHGHILYMGLVCISILLIAWILGGGLRRRRSRREPGTGTGHPCLVKFTTNGQFAEPKTAARAASPSARATPEDSTPRIGESRRSRALPIASVRQLRVLPFATVFVPPIAHYCVTRPGVPFFIPPQVFQRGGQKELLAVKRRMSQRFQQTLGHKNGDFLGREA